MTQAEKESLQTHLHLWSHYNILYWTVFSISTFGLLLSGVLVVIKYWDFLDSNLVVYALLLISMFSIFFFKITANFHTYRLYHQQKVSELSKNSVSEYIPEISNLGTTRFAKTRGFVAASILYYLIFAIGIYFAILLGVLYLFIIDQDWIILLVISAPIAILVGFLIYWIVRVKNWNIEEKLKEPK